MNISLQHFSFLISLSEPLLTFEHISFFIVPFNIPQITPGLYFSVKDLFMILQVSSGDTTLCSITNAVGTLIFIYYINQVTMM